MQTDDISSQPWVCQFSKWKLSSTPTKLLVSHIQTKHTKRLILLFQ
jgi:hypothetical protein